MKLIRIIIVDDCEVMRKGLITFMRNHAPNFEVVAEVPNGYAAVERARDLNPDLVIMDVRMPGMDGITTTREMKANVPLTRILMYSGSDCEEDVFAAFAAGADGYCLKSSSPELLVSAVNAVADGVGWIDPPLAKFIFNLCVLKHSETIALLEQTSGQQILSPREMDVLTYMTQGMSNGAIGAQLGISSETVKTHLRHIMKKMDVADRTQAAVKAIRTGLISSAFQPIRLDSRFLENGLEK